MVGSAKVGRPQFRRPQLCRPQAECESNGTSHLLLSVRPDRVLTSVSPSQSLRSACLVLQLVGLDIHNELFTATQWSGELGDSTRPACASQHLPERVYAASGGVVSVCLEGGWCADLFKAASSIQYCLLLSKPSLPPSLWVPS